MARFSTPRSSRATTTPALTAAVQRVTDPRRAFTASLYTTPGGDWQQQAWNYYRQVGELRYYVFWRANSASRCRLVASDIDPETGKPTGNTKNEAVRAIVRDIGGGVTGQSQMMHRMTAMLTVPGEGWYAMVVRDATREITSNGSKAVPIRGTDQTEQWFTLSREEISFKGRDLILTLPDAVKHTYNPDTDLLFRVWNEDLEKAHLPDSPVRSNFAALNEIVRATAAIDNASQSRLIGNGIVVLPQEFSMPSQKAPGAIPPDGEEPAVPVMEQAEAQDLQDLLYEVGTTAVKDPQSLAALMPIIITAPGEAIKNAQHLKFGSDVSETALKTRDKAIERLARGLEVSPERLLGMAANSNHWGAWAVGEDDIKVHIAPPVETICDAFTKAILREKLLQLGLDPDAYTVWYETTELTQDPDKKDEAKEAFDRGAITSAALRTHFGFDDEDGYDLKTAAGWVQLAMDRCANDPSLIPMFAPILGSLVDGITGPAPAQAIEQAPAGDAPAPEAEPQSGPEPPEPEDESLPAAAYSFTRVCVARAMELANKRRRTRANHAAFDGELALDQAHIRLEPTTGAARLIEGWDSVLNDDDVAAFGLDRTKLSAVVLAAASDALGTSRAWKITHADVARARR